MIKFLHAADLHLDSPFHGLSPENAAQRRKEQRQQLFTIAELANSHGCDLVLLSGDLFDSENAFPETVEALCRALGSMNARVFIAPGNHDYITEKSPYLTRNFPENVHIFSKNTPEAVHLPQLNCTVCGAAFTSPHAASLLEGFRAEGGSTHRIMVLHGEAESSRSAYNPVTKQQIEASGLDYLALGHVHTRSGPRKLGRTTYAWPGCTMGRGFDETGEKGVYLGSLDENGVELTFCPLPAVRYEVITVPMGSDPLAAIEAALPRDAENTICRICLTGESDPLDLRSLCAALAPRFHTLQLRDETTPKTDLWQWAGDDTLKGRYLALLQEKLAAADEEEQAILLLAARLGLAAMEGREEVLPC